MMYSFVIAGFVCALAALVYSEIAAIVPVAGSAYTYSYAVFGELIAWMVGWALILEYAVAAAAVAVGWSGYINGFLHEIGYGLPLAWTAGPRDTIVLADGTVSAGGFNLLAFLISLFVTFLLIIGTAKSARFTAVLVIVKIIALTVFIVLAMPAVNAVNFEPMLPNGWGTPASGVGVLGAAASIFFAYIGFDAVSTAAEETKNPNRNVPIGLIGSLGICTIFYLIVAYAAVGAVGAQPGGELSQSKEPLAFVLRAVGYPAIGNWVASAAIIALPSVVLMMIYGHCRGLVRRDVPGRHACRCVQLRHPVCILHGGSERDGIAPSRTRSASSFQDTNDLDCWPIGHGRVRPAVHQPGLGNHQVVPVLGRNRPGRLFQLCPQA